MTTRIKQGAGTKDSRTMQVARSTLSQGTGAMGQAPLLLVAALKQEVLACRVLHADESPIQVLAQQGDAKRSYIWAFGPAQGQPTRAVIYEINPGRSGEHARCFLCREAPPGSAPGAPPWSGHLMVDDYAGYKALFTGNAGGSVPVKSGKSLVLI